MTLEGSGRSILGYATLQRTRALLASRSARAMAVFIGVVYGFVAMLVGEMLVLAENVGPHYALVLWSSGNGTAPWNYPALLVSASWGSLALPFFPTIAMVVMSAGVGLGMAVSVLLAVRLIRQPRRALGGPTAMGSAAGLTPAMIAIVTLGACCSTTAAATAGLGVVAQASGTSIDQLLANDWYVGVFQITVLWIALVAQEQLIAVYGVLFGLESAGAGPTAAVPARPRHYVIGGGMRAVLLAAGVVGALAMLADWINTSPGSASAVTWVHWVLQFELVAVVAGVAALFPTGLRTATDDSSSMVLKGVRAAVLVAGISLIGWFPAALSQQGLQGLGNGLLGLAGLPPSWGAVTTSGSDTWIGLSRWVAEYAVLGSFAIAWAWDPDRTLRALTGDFSRRLGPPGASDRVPARFPPASPIPPPAPASPGAPVRVAPAPTGFAGKAADGDR